MRYHLFQDFRWKGVKTSNDNLTVCKQKYIAVNHVRFVKACPVFSQKESPATGSSPIIWFSYCVNFSLTWSDLIVPLTNTVFSYNAFFTLPRSTSTVHLSYNLRDTHVHLFSFTHLTLHLFNCRHSQGSSRNRFY